MAPRTQRKHLMPFVRPLNHHSKLFSKNAAGQTIRINEHWHYEKANFWDKNSCQHIVK